MRITHILVILTLTQATTFLSDTYTLIYDQQSSLFSEEELAKNTEIKSTKDENVNYLDEQLSSLANADESQTLLAYEKDLPASGDCIILYSQCNFKGASSKVCKDPSEAMSFQSPVYSIYVPDGQQFSTLDTNSQSEVTFLTSDDCLEEPIVMVGQLDFLIAQSSQYWIGESITTDQSPTLIQLQQEQAPEVATESQEQITEQPQTEQSESQVEQPQTEEPQIQQSEQPETQVEQPETQVEQPETQAEQPETQAEQVEQAETQTEQPETQEEQVAQPEAQAEQPEAQAEQPEAQAEQTETSAEQPVQTEAEDDKQVEQVIEKVEEVVEQVTDLQEAELNAQKAAQETKETDQPAETEGSVDDIPSVEVQEPEQTSEPLVGQTQLQK